jgi:hypothetical protein
MILVSVAFYLPNLFLLRDFWKHISSCFFVAVCKSDSHYFVVQGVIDSDAKAPFCPVFLHSGFCTWLLSHRSMQVRTSRDVGKWCSQEILCTSGRNENKERGSDWWSFRRVPFHWYLNLLKPPSACRTPCAQSRKLSQRIPFVHLLNYEFCRESALDVMDVLL